MKRTYAFRDGKFVEITPDRAPDVHYVQDDIKPFRSPDGAMIEGARQWREHLKRTGSIELNHADMKTAQEKWQKRRAAFSDKVASAEKNNVREVAPPSGEIRPTERNRLWAEMANRLDNRPTPDRKTLIKLTLETARDLARRR